MNNVFILTHTWRTRHENDTTDILGVFATKELAVSALADSKTTIFKDMYSNIDEDDVEITDDCDDSYEIMANEWEQFDELTITEYNVTDKSSARFLVEVVDGDEIQYYSDNGLVANPGFAKKFSTEAFANMVAGNIGAANHTKVSVRKFVNGTVM